MHVHGPSRLGLSKQTRAALKWGPGNWRQEIWMDSYRAAWLGTGAGPLLSKFRTSAPEIGIVESVAAFTTIVNLVRRVRSPADLPPPSPTRHVPLIVLEFGRPSPSLSLFS
ncbi:hypothetical protein ElyMa_005454500 [Elysia marginata]|uniref:Uncharacterized protein n=1 Tax=Elysia marginata TaxID=1093978 RepID=A0AAV4EPP7_9GAST|nr:hypothetical protein ElyMa_005454500 [Elysia marginata]